MDFKVPENKKELFIKTAVWNSFIEVFKEKKNIDVTEYLISIKVNFDNIVIKTNKPIISSEALLLDREIKEKIDKKLFSLNIKLWIDNIKYI